MELESDAIEYLPENESSHQAENIASPEKFDEQIPTPPEKHEEPAFLQQLKDKIRTQAQDLQSLEQYKSLVEKRIIELCPDHPLPVLPTHLGKGGPTGTFSFRQLNQNMVPVADLKKIVSSKDQELHYANQRIDKLLAENEKLRSLANGRTEPTFQGMPQSPELVNTKITELQREKQGIEEALRSEMLENEEQRNYIQILKQALEAKIEDFGFSEVLNAARSGTQPASSVDIFVEMTNIKKEADASRKEKIKFENHAMQLDAQFSDMEKTVQELVQENGEIKDENEKLKEDLKQGMQALEENRGILNKLEEEKNTLLDSLEDLTEKSEQYAKNMEDMQSQLQKATSEKEQIEKKNEELTAKSKLSDKLQFELDSLKKDYENAQNISTNQNNELNSLNEEKRKILKELTDLREKSKKFTDEISKKDFEFRNLQSRFDENTKNHEKLQQDFTVLKDDLRNLQQNYAAQSETLGELQAEADQLRNDRSKIMKEYEELERKYNEVYDKFKVYDESINESKKELGLSRKMRENDIQDREILISKLSQENNELKTLLSQQKETLENTMHSKNHEFVEIQEETQKIKSEQIELRNELIKTKEELVRSRDLCENLKKEYDIASERSRHYQTQLENYKKENTNLVELQKKSDEFKNEYEKCRKIIKDKENLIDEMNIKLLGTNSRFEENQTIIKNLEEELRKMREELKNTVEENSELKINLNNVFLLAILLKK